MAEHNGPEPCEADQQTVAVHDANEDDVPLTHTERVLAPLLALLAPDFGFSTPCPEYTVITLTPTPHAMQKAMECAKDCKICDHSKEFGVVEFTVVFQFDLDSTSFGKISAEHSTPSDTISGGDLCIVRILLNRAGSIIEEAGERICRYCAKPPDCTLKVCSGCSQRLYCSKACQTGDWPRHRSACATKGRENMERQRECPAYAAAARHSTSEVHHGEK
jgi:hypothetical protein